MTDRMELKQLLLHNLHPIVAHEQGLHLKTAAGVRLLTHPTPPHPTPQQCHAAAHRSARGCVCTC